MKIWELEVGKLYTTGGYVYKIDSSRNLSFLTKGNYSKWITTNASYNVVVGFDFEEVKRELDWFKVPNWTKVQVMGGKKEKWINAYFIDYFITNKDYPYVVTFRDEFTFDEDEGECNIDFFDTIRLHPSVTPQEDWFKDTDLFRGNEEC